MHYPRLAGFVSILLDMAAKIIAVASSKGGVGKTTTSVSLASHWASSGRDTYLVDADHQGAGSASSWMARAQLTPHLDWIDLRVEVDQTPGVSMAQAIDSLRSVDEGYEFIVVDTPPDQESPVLSQVCAIADLVVVVAGQDFDESQAAVDTITSTVMPTGTSGVVVMTMADVRSIAFTNELRQAIESQGIRTLPTPIRHYVVMRYSKMHGQLPHEMTGDNAANAKADIASVANEIEIALK